MHLHLQTRIMEMGEEMFSRGICLPSGSGLSMEEVKWVGENVHKFLMERV